MFISLHDSGWFYLANIFLAALGTALTSTMIIIQQRGHLGQEVPAGIRRIFMVYLGPLVGFSPPISWRNEILRRKTMRCAKKERHSVPNDKDPSVGQLYEAIGKIWKYFMVFQLPPRSLSFPDGNTVVDQNLRYLLLFEKSMNIHNFYIQQGL